MKRKANLNPDAPLKLEGHGKPVSRRDFLSRGLISGAGVVVAPSVLSFLGVPSQALAQFSNCGLTVGSGKIPFLCFDLAGGANISA